MRSPILPFLLAAAACASVVFAAEDSPAQSSASSPALPNDVATSVPRTGPLAPGEDAPDFTLPAGTGESVTLSDFRGKSVVVLYFYPKDNTPGCTQEAEDFRDVADRIRKSGAVVLGVSVDDRSSHRAFTNKYKLNFPLLTDLGGRVARQYGVMGWIMAKRVTYIIGRDGKIKDAFTDVSVPGHASAVLRKLTEGESPAPKAKGKPKKKNRSRT